jgi:hypothetical protein
MHTSTSELIVLQVREGNGAYLQARGWCGVDGITSLGRTMVLRARGRWCCRLGVDGVTVLGTTWGRRCRSLEDGTGSIASWARGGQEHCKLEDGTWSTVSRARGWHLRGRWRRRLRVREGGGAYGVLYRVQGHRHEGSRLVDDGASSREFSVANFGSLEGWVKTSRD